MRKLAILLSFLGYLCHAQEQGTSFSEALKSKKADVTFIYKKSNPNYDFNNGLVVENQLGAISGLLVDVMNEFSLYVAEKYGIDMKPKYVGMETSFKLFTQAIADGNNGVFGLGSHSITEERKKFLQFSPAYIKNVSVLVSHSSVPTLSGLNRLAEEFDDKTALTINSTTYHRRFEALKETSYPNMKISFEKNIFELLPAIASNSNTYGFVDLIYYLRYLKLGNPIKRHPVGDLRGDEYGITMPLSNDWAPIMKEFFDSGFLKSPQYRQIVIDNLGKEALRMISL